MLKLVIIFFLAFSNYINAEPSDNIENQKDYNISSPNNSRFYLAKNTNKKKQKKEEGSKKTRPKEDDKLPSKNQHWYMLWGLKFPSGSYDKKTNSTLDYLKNKYDVINIPMYWDLAGFYLPLNNKKTMLGFIFNVLADLYNVHDTNMAISIYTPSFSGHHFFGKNIGHGFFLRGDIGFSRYKIYLKDPDNKYEKNSKKGWGIGLLVGLGWGVPISRAVRLLFSGDYAYRSFKSGHADIFSLSIGVLF